MAFSCDSSLCQRQGMLARLILELSLNAKAPARIGHDERPRCVAPRHQPSLLQTSLPRAIFWTNVSGVAWHHRQLLSASRRRLAATIAFFEQTFLFLDKLQQRLRTGVREEWMGARRCPREKACSCTNDLPRHIRPRRHGHDRLVG